MTRIPGVGGATSEFQKFRLPPDANQLYMRTVLSHREGRLAIVTDAGQDAVDADALQTSGA
jgi:hypothetical protein